MVCVGGLLALAVTLVDPAASKAGAPDPVMTGAWAVPGVSNLQSALVAGTDGDEWFVDADNGELQLEQITPTGSISAPGAQFGSDSTVQVPAMVADGGSIWAAAEGGVLHQLSNDGTHIQDSLPAAGGGAAGNDTDATVGPDGDLYVADPNNNASAGGSIDQFSTSGAEQTFTALPTKNAQGDDGSEPEAIVAVGNTIFFSSGDLGSLESITTDGKDASLYSTASNGVSVSPTPGSMVAGPDGDLWTISDSGSNNTSFEGNEIEQISPTGTLLKTYSTGFATYMSALTSLTIGPDGQLWFPEDGANAVGALNPSTGAITNYPMPMGIIATHSSAIAPGANGTIWFTAFNQSDQYAVGEVSGLTGAAPPTTPTPDPTATNVSCTRSNVADGGGAECTATVTDKASTGYTPPIGTVTFSTSPFLATFDPSATCTLSATDAGTASCTATFVPDEHENYTLTVTYSGDASHQASSGQSGTLTTFVPPTPPVEISNGGGTSTPGVGGVSVSPQPASVASGISFTVPSAPANVARLPVTCQGSSACNLTLTVSVVEKLLGGKLIAITALARPDKRKKAVLKTVVVGTTKVTIAAGERRTVTIRLNATGRRLVAEHGLKTKLTITEKGAKTHTATFTFTAPKPVKKKAK